MYKDRAGNTINEENLILDRQMENFEEKLISTIPTNKLR